MSGPLWRSRSRRGSLTAIALLTVSGCDGCLSFPWGEDETPIGDWEDAADASEAAVSEIARLRIVPDAVHAPQGSQFTLRARAWDGAGHRTSVPSGLTWTSTGGVTFTGNDPVTLTLPASLPPGELVVHVTDGSHTSPPAKIIVAVGTGDRLSLPHTAGDAPEAAILDAGQGATCLGDHTVMVSSDADLGMNFTPGCPAPPEVAVFSQAAGGLFEASPLAATPGTVPPWTAATADHLTRSSLPSVRTVPVSLRVRAANPGDQAIAAVQQIEVIASGIFRAGRAGVAFVVASQTEGTGATVSTSVCNSASSLASYGVDVGQTRLFVLVVDAIVEGNSGWTCPIPAGQNAQVILVEAGRHKTTLAHEFGHALGVNQPIGYSGHSGDFVYNMRGFEYPNLMWKTVDTSYDVPRTELSLGQVFRMNVHQDSWLARLSGAGPTAPCQCQHYTSDPCPALDLDVPGASSPPGSNLVCGS